MRVHVAIAVALASAVRLAAASAAPLAVPLALEERAGVARHAFPARASVPFPRGRLKPTTPLWLAAGERRVPLQTEVLERWPDGTVRFLLLDFLADVGARKTATYVLREGPGPAAPAGPAVRLERPAADHWVLDTGAVRVDLRPDALFAGIAAGDARMGAIAEPELVVDGVRGGPAGRATLAVETEGPVRTEILLGGRYPAGMAYEVRVAAFAGEPFLRVAHTITNLADALYAPVRSLRLVVPGTFTSAAVGLDGLARPLGSLTAVHRVVHRDATPALLDGGPAGRHADGWVRANGSDLAVTLLAPEFWQQYPKVLEASADHLAIDLLGGGDAPVPFGTGAAKTHEVWVAVEPAKAAAPAASLAAALDAPLVASPPAAWTAASRALPQALDPAAAGARDFLARLATAYAGYEKHVARDRWDDGPPVACRARTTEHPRTGFYGDLNWGDWQFPGYRDMTRGCDGWGNLEYDLPQVLALAWAATGSPQFLAGLDAAARHYRDVDIIHHAPGHLDWIGLNHPHKPLHFSFEAEEKIDLGHVWTEGLVSYWRLTGDRRALAAARRLADALVPRIAKAKNPRQFGWPMLALVAVWDATGDARYRDAALAYATAGIAAFRPTPAAGDWKMGILADGVAAVDAATGDARLRRWLVAYAEALAAGRTRWTDPRYALPLGYLAAATGDPRWAAEARDVVARMKIGEWGKPLAATARTGFRLLAPLPATPEPSRPATVHAPLTRGRDAPPRASPDGRRRPSPSPGAPARRSDD